MSSKSKVDCHFFLTGTCRNGANCPFRHSEGARNTTDICPAYSQTGQCPEDDCGKRHTTAEKSTRQPPSEVPCRNEENGGVCKRPGCIFKHRQVEDRNMEWNSNEQRDMEWTPNEQESTKIPTIYEILGIPEDPPVDPIEFQRNRRIQ